MRCALREVRAHLCRDSGVCPEVNVNACLKGRREARRCEMVQEECAWGIETSGWTVHVDAFCGDTRSLHVDAFFIFVSDFVDLLNDFV